MSPDYKEMVAAVCHNAIKGLCEFHGDYSNPSFDEIELWQLESTYSGIDFVIENPDVTPQELHESWMKYKIEQGWFYGEEKDPEKKTHPCLVPYDQLPEFQQLKDSVFRSIVKGFM